MYPTLLIDTDIVIDYLRHCESAIDYIEKMQNPFLLSAITVAELFVGIRDNHEKNAIESFLDACKIISVDRDIAQTGGAFRQKYGKSHGTEFTDALIAATAHHHEATLVTLNTRHFPMVKTIRPYGK